MKKVLIGAHTSAAGGAPHALYEGREIGASVIQLFTSNQKQWHGRHIGAEEVEEWERAQGETGITHVMSHDSYLINLGSPHELTSRLSGRRGQFVRRVLEDENKILARLDAFVGGVLPRLGRSVDDDETFLCWHNWLGARAN